MVSSDGRRRASRLLFACLCLVLAWPIFGQPAGQLEVHFISVGQADATLIRCPKENSYMLIDAADTRYPSSAEQFKSYLQAQFKDKRKRLDIVVASHAHTDHIGSMLWVLENFEVSTYVDSGDTAETRVWANLQRARQRLSKQGKLEYVNSKKARNVELQFCATSGVLVEVFSPWAFSKQLTDANDRSAVVRLAHREISFLFVGDAHDNAENVMLASIPEDIRKKLDVDVLKVGHHGSHTSSSSDFVMAVSPVLAIISSGRKDVGTNARYKHPRFKTITTYSNWFKTADRARAEKGNTPPGRIWAYDDGSRDWRQVQRPPGLWLTTVDGTIIVRSDGARLYVSRAAGKPGDEP